MALPIITSITPLSGPNGTFVFINGSNFNESPLTVSMDINVPGEQMYIVSHTDTQITAIVVNFYDNNNTRNRTKCKFTISNASGSITSTQEFQYPSATISSFTPSVVWIGDTVRIYGTNLQFNTKIQLTYYPRLTGYNPIITKPVVSNYDPSGTWCEFVMPPQTGTTLDDVRLYGDGVKIAIDITNDYQPTKQRVNLSFITYKSPIITSFTSTAYADGNYYNENDRLVITGMNLQNVNLVTINDQAVNPCYHGLSADGKTLKIMPPMFGGNIKLYNGGNVYNLVWSSSQTFTPMPPLITSFTPTTEQAGATVTIYGKNLCSNESNNPPVVKFNGVIAQVTDYYKGDNKITVIAPNSNTGQITVSNSLGTATSSSNFVYIPTPITIMFASDLVGGTLLSNVQYSLNDAEWQQLPGRLFANSNDMIAYKGTFIKSSDKLNLNAQIKTNLGHSYSQVNSYDITMSTPPLAGCYSSYTVTFYGESFGTQGSGGGGRKPPVLQPES